MKAVITRHLLLSIAQYFCIIFLGHQPALCVILEIVHVSYGQVVKWYGSALESVSVLQSSTCHMGSNSVTCLLPNTG